MTSIVLNVGVIEEFKKHKLEARQVSFTANLGRNTRKNPLCC